MKHRKWKVIAREYVVSLFPTFQLIDSFAYSIKRTLGINLGAFGAKYEDHAIWWLKYELGWKRAHQILASRVSKNYDWFSRVLKTIEQQGKSLVRWAEMINKDNLTKLSNTKLWQYYKELVRRNQELYDIGLFCPLLDYQDQTFLTDSLTDLLEKKIPTAEVGTYISIFTTPVRKSLDVEQTEKLLSLYSNLYHSQYVMRLLVGRLATIEILPLLNEHQPGWYKKFRRHVKRFAYLIYVYEGPPATDEFFVDIIRDWVKRRVNPQKELARLAQQRLKQHQIQTKYLHQLKFTTHQRKLVSLARDTTFIKPYRRFLQTQVYYLAEPLLVEIAKRLGLSLRQVRYLLPLEVKKALLHGRLDINELNKRINYCVYLNYNNRIKVLTGGKARKFWQTRVEKEKVPPHVKELVGTTASPGKAQGRVCVVNMPEDMVNMKRGNILVSSATSPNLMPAIRQAAAIVTDEGGLTSHAAIVSRELDIPCVIGTKIATQVLKDGDKVEVDAARGVIRRVYGKI